MFSGSLNAGSSPSWPTATAGDPPRGVRSTLSAAAEEDARPARRARHGPRRSTRRRRRASSRRRARARRARAGKRQRRRRVVSSRAQHLENHPCLSSRLRSQRASPPRPAPGAPSRASGSDALPKIVNARAACVLRLAQGALRSEGVARQSNTTEKPRRPQLDVRKQYTRSEILTHNLLKTRCESRREIFFASTMRTLGRGLPLAVSERSRPDSGQSDAHQRFTHDERRRARSLLRARGGARREGCEASAVTRRMRRKSPRSSPRRRPIRRARMATPRPRGARRARARPPRAGMPRVRPPRAPSPRWSR